MNQSNVVVVVMVNVFGPGFTDNVYQHSVDWVVKLDHHERRSVAFLNQERVVIDGKSFLRFVRDDSDVFFVRGILKAEKNSVS